MKIKELFEARRVSAGTLSAAKKKASDQVTDFRHTPYDPANPYHADEKKRRDAEKAKQPKYTKKELRAKAKEVAKQIKDEYESGGYDELFATDLIDHFVDHRKDPLLWDAVHDILTGY